MRPFFHFTFAFLQFHGVLATTEWFGDQRAHLNPPQSPPFYDVIYDDSGCAQGVQSNAIPEYAYFGEMLATHNVEDHATCLHHCLKQSKCRAVNYFDPISTDEKGFCELLSGTQLDNPKLMRPFHKAVYFEKIRCRSADDFDQLDSEESDQPKTITSTPTTATPHIRQEKLSLMKKLSEAVRKINLRFRDAVATTN